MTTEDIDLHLAVICASETLPTPIKGWSAEDLADLIGCSPAAIHRRTAAAMLTVKSKLPADILQDLKN